MDSILLTVLVTTVTLVIIAVIVWLVFEYKKLKQEYQTLSEYIQRNSTDIAGLCSAAVSVDKQISLNDQKFNDIFEKLAEFEVQQQQQQNVSQPYHSAIQMVKNGAVEEELIEQCGLSKEEAILLIRLHGHRNDMLNQ